MDYKAELERIDRKCEEDKYTLLGDYLETILHQLSIGYTRVFPSAKTMRIYKIDYRDQVIHLIVEMDKKKIIFEVEGTGFSTSEDFFPYGEIFDEHFVLSGLQRTRTLLNAWFYGEKE